MEPEYILITNNNAKYIMQKHYRTKNYIEYWEPIYKNIQQEWLPVDNLDLLVLTTSTTGEINDLLSGNIEVIQNLDTFLNTQMTEKFEEFL